MLLYSPRLPRSGAPLRVIAVSERSFDAELTVGRAGEAPVEAPRRGAYPYWWVAEIPSPEPGVHTARLRGPGVHGCLRVEVASADDSPTPPRPGWGTVWPVSRAWDRDLENLYSAWIEKLFDDPLDAQPTWTVLHEVLRDPQRNFLFDHLGLGEDDPARHAPRIDPDCADLPYFLRAYFAFKLSLPFGYSRCTRGGSSGPPTCVRWSTSMTASKIEGRHPAKRLGNFLAVNLANAVHSGAVRAAATDDANDFYPIKLARDTLRPGAIFADPYGHIMVVSRRVPQKDSQSGMLFAVDGQPDGTVSRRRFWRGNFLFSDDYSLGSPGFKRFRPVVVDGRRPRTLSNAEIARHPDWGDYSLEQYASGVEGFYDLVDDVLNPNPIDPGRAMKETIQALDEQVRRRVLSVQNGVDFVRDHPGTVDMPEGPEIFETVGPWEDFSTPSRDMRLLIAIDVVRGFPARVARRPERYAMPEGRSREQIERDLVALLEREAGSRKFRYTRSDGSPFELTLADVLSRARELEMAYNPNDCPEVRWAAPEASDERATCKRRAPQSQRERMQRYRPWFATRRRPRRD
ncbi:MAG: hypothetical protein JRI55_24120 [Deltaproteobacteria bacterium]|jgi:hypothetical protein|nr:hypothetical protein [Deltaproteobacteria bacterium]